MLELHYAVPGVGGVLVPLNTRLARRRVRLHPRALRREGARRRSRELREQLGDDAPRSVVAADEYEELLEAADPVDLERPEDERTLISINYTSGTTGRPRA